MSRNQERMSPPPPVRLAPGPAPWRFQEDGSFTLEAGERLPPVGWTQVLCNETFGWLTDEGGGGFLWSGGNARERKLSPWVNDPLAVGGPESITLTVDGREYPVFAAGDGLPCAVTYSPGLARWVKELPGGRLTAEAFVPLEGERRVLRFTLTGVSGRLSWRLEEGEPVTSALSDGGTVSLVAKGSEGRLCARFFREDFREEQRRTLDWWRERTAALTFSTPEGALDRCLGGWCLYQVIA